MSITVTQREEGLRLSERQRQGDSRGRDFVHFFLFSNGRGKYTSIAVLLVSADDFQFMARVRMVQWIGCLLYIYIGDFADSNHTISFFL